eukprot:INCI4213.1.p1 GENE.INCI4213.1~~INCI4213.1.p1  ORF type:complete len:893 (-),score=132.09 INCI4213.1:933-3611(-)
MTAFQVVLGLAALLFVLSTTPAFAEESNADQPLCKVGSAVAAKWGGNGAFYHARIEQLDASTKTVVVAWADGDTSFTVVKPEDVRGCRVDFDGEAASSRGSGGIVNRGRPQSDGICQRGSTIAARYRGDQKFYMARIDSIESNSDGDISIVVTWNDGDTKFRRLPFDQNWVHGCRLAASAAVPVPSKEESAGTATSRTSSHATSTSSTARSRSSTSGSDNVGRGSQSNGREGRHSGQRRGHEHTESRSGDSSAAAKSAQSGASKAANVNRAKAKREAERISNFYGDPVEMKKAPAPETFAAGTEHLRVFIQEDKHASSIGKASEGAHAAPSVTCKHVYRLWILEWPAVDSLVDCAHVCAHDPSCNFIFWQDKGSGNPAHPMGLQCMGFSSCFDPSLARKRRYDAASPGGGVTYLVTASELPAGDAAAHESPDHSSDFAPCSFHCSRKLVGNGVCDWQPPGPPTGEFITGPANCNCRRTDWDGGDCCVDTCRGGPKRCGTQPMHCIDPSQQGFRAQVAAARKLKSYDETCVGVDGEDSCRKRWMGDHFCDSACFTESCQWDGGDCDVGATPSVVAEARSGAGKLPVPHAVAHILATDPSMSTLEAVLKARQLRAAGTPIPTPLFAEGPGQAVDPQFPLTAERRLLAVQLALRQLANASAGSEAMLKTEHRVFEPLLLHEVPHWGTWAQVRAVLLQACGLRDANNVQNAIFTQHCFSDPYHVDCCAMEVAWKQLARKIPASAKHAAETKDTTQVESDDGLIGSDDDVASSFDVKSQIVSPIGPGVLRASLGHPAHGVSWCTRTILTPGSSNPQPTLNFCGAQHGARLAFKMVWCPGIDGAFDQFVVLDHDGDILSLGRLDGADDLPPLQERIEVRSSATLPSTFPCLCLCRNPE